MVLRKWAREYLCKRFLIDHADTVVDQVFRDPRFSVLENHDDYMVPEGVKNLLIERLRACGLAWLEEHQPTAWFISFFKSKPGQPT